MTHVHVCTGGVPSCLAVQGVLGIADVDTRAITRALRTTGCLNGVITTDASIPDAELVERTKSWSILGKDLISEVRLRLWTGVWVSGGTVLLERSVCKCPGAFPLVDMPDAVGLAMPQQGCSLLRA